GLGMLAYAVFRFLGAYEDVDAHGHEAKGIAKRTFFALSGLPYLALGVTAIGIVIGHHRASDSSGSTSNGQQEAASALMSQPMGVWLVGLLGAACIAFAIFQVYVGAKEKFLRKVKTVSLSPEKLKTI